MPALPPLATLLAFEAVARRRSFALAATELHLTASAVSHQIARLEAFLGVRLFERSSEGVRLSPQGDAYLQRVTDALGALTAATHDLREGTQRRLAVHATPSLTALWLMPRLADFTKAHPDIALTLSASPAHSDFAAGRVDLDIRYGVPRWPGLVVEALFDEPVLPLASPALLRRITATARRRTLRAADLLQAPLIQSSVSIVQWSDWLAAQGVDAAPERYALRVDRAQLALDAAVQGLGVALESATVAATHLARRQLVAPFGLRKAVVVQGHHIVHPAANGQRAEVAAFIAWLRRQAAASAPAKRR